MAKFEGRCTIAHLKMTTATKPEAARRLLDKNPQVVQDLLGRLP